jgi:hypothetical protein
MPAYTFEALDDNGKQRTGVLEASTRQCPHCEGTGLVRTASSAGLSALRLIEDEAARGRGSLIQLRASQEAAFYVLNKKRADIAEVEDSYQSVKATGSLNGERSIVLMVQRQPNANTVQVVDSVRALMPRFETQLPQSIKIHLVNDRSDSI